MVAGAAVARVIVPRRGWREARLFVLLLIAAWFVCSGLAELAVSGGETIRLVWGTPSAAALAALKARADAALLVATIALLVCLLAYPLMRNRISAGRHRE
ncbi:MAG TPA: hypothetical protein VLJ14_18020 [Ktedonobacterales bacterium]|nr:hypothetical protein [Ktedonobacterales bacterium]